MRDDFPTKVKRDLERRVNGKCSNPNHRVPTSGPTGISSDSVNIGVAAHISAAAPGGPRYDPQMTAEQRSSIENGIWLCQNCAAHIDRDTYTYSVETLKQWRQIAEVLAKEEFGQIPISREHYEFMQAMLMEKHFHRHGIDPLVVFNKIAAQYLEKQDPRFKVEVKRSENRTTYTYLAQETVDLSLTVKHEFSQEFADKLQSLSKHGLDLQIPSSAISLHGSPLFSGFQDGGYTFVLKATHRRRATVLIELFEKSDGKRFFAEAAGELTAGTESIRFSGTALNDLFKIELVLAKESTNAEVAAEFIFDKWNGVDVLKLPNFDRLWAYYEGALGGRGMQLELEVEGVRLATLSGKIPKDKINNLAILRYINNTRIISRKLGANVAFNSNSKLNWRDFEEIDNLRARLEISSPKSLSSNAILTLVPPANHGPEHVQKYIRDAKGEIKIENECEGFVLFDQILPRFKMTTVFSPATLKQVGRIKKGGFKVEIIPEEHSVVACDISIIS